jgi:uncharacterized OsmC-like protein
MPEESEKKNTLPVLKLVNLISNDISEEDFKKVLKLSEETYCPVWALLKGNVDIEVTCRIVS